MSVPSSNFLTDHFDNSVQAPQFLIDNVGFSPSFLTDHSIMSVPCTKFLTGHRHAVCRVAAPHILTDHFDFIKIIFEIYIPNC